MFLHICNKSSVSLEIKTIKSAVMYVVRVEKQTSQSTFMANVKTESEVSKRIFWSIKVDRPYI